MKVRSMPALSGTNMFDHFGNVFSKLAHTLGEAGRKGLPGLAGLSKRAIGKVAQKASAAIALSRTGMASAAMLAKRGAKDIGDGIKEPFTKNKKPLLIGAGIFVALALSGTALLIVAILTV